MLAQTAINDSIGFVREFIPAANAKIIEVGTGEDLIATELSTHGYQVTALDTSEAGFLDYNADLGFDAVLFSRSFSRMASLETALNKAKLLLNDTGKILIDDRTAEAMDSRTARWFYDLLDVYRVLADAPEATVFPGDGPLDRWKREHQNEKGVHSRLEMMRMMERNFGSIYSGNVPCLYRFFVEGSANLVRGSEAVEKVFEIEKSLIEQELIQPIGFRIASKKYFSYLG